MIWPKLNAKRVKRGDQAEPSLPELHIVGALNLPHGYQARYATGLEALLRTLQETAFVTLDELECNTHLGLRALRSLPNLRVSRVLWKQTCHQLGEPVFATSATPEQLLLALKSHAHLQELTVEGVRLTGALLGRVVDVVLKRQLTQLTFRSTQLDAASAPQLTRLLQDSALRSLTLEGESESSLFDSLSRPLFASALRTNTTLKKVKLSNLYEWRHLMPALCAALAGHPSIESLCICEVVFGDSEGDLSTLDESLALPLTADAPALALARLYVNFFVDGEPDQPVQLPRMFSALVGNTHLRALNVGVLDSSAASMLDSVVPALRTNAGLRELHITIAGPLTDKAAKRALEAAARRFGPWVKQTP